MTWEKMTVEEKCEALADKMDNIEAALWVLSVRLTQHGHSFFLQPTPGSAYCPETPEPEIDALGRREKKENEKE